MNYKYLYTKVFASIVLIVFTLSCKHKDNNVGPSICASESFQITTPFQMMGTTATSVNLKATQVSFTATFNEVAPWTIKLTGVTSGAKKEFSGKSSSVNQQWDGTSNSSTFFQVEDVTVVFEVACREQFTQTLTMSITSTTDFKNAGYLIANFDAPEAGKVTSWYGSTSSKVTFNGITNSTVPTSPQGGNYWNVTGNSSILEWYFGGFGNNTDMTMAPNSIKTALPSDPSRVYLNMFLNSNGKLNSQAQLLLRESNSSFTKDRRKNFTINWTGWQLVSFKLSEIGIVNPQDITVLDIGLGSAPEQGMTAEMNIDLILFTVDKPLY